MNTKQHWMSSGTMKKMRRTWLASVTSLLRNLRHSTHTQMTW